MSRVLVFVVAVAFASCMALASAAPSSVRTLLAGVPKVSTSVQGANKHDCAAWPTGTGILRDGDFHLQVDPGHGFWEYWRGSVFAQGWAPVKRGSIDFNGSTGWGTKAPNGVCTIDMDGLSAATLKTKRFATQPSASYTVGFILSGNGFCPPQIKQLQISAAGQSQQFTWDISGGNDASRGAWSAETWGFTATSSETAITISSLDPRTAHCGPVVGAFSVTAN